MVPVQVLGGEDHDAAESAVKSKGKKKKKKKTKVLKEGSHKEAVLGLSWNQMQVRASPPPLLRVLFSPLPLLTVLFSSSSSACALLSSSSRVSQLVLTFRMVLHQRHRLL